MATYKLVALETFPQGTTVGAYREADIPAHLRPPTGAPTATPVETQVMDSDGADFVALNAEPYWFGSSVDGAWRWVRGTPTADSTKAGLLAARPSAAEVGAGATYFATDDNGGTLYASDGAAWSKALTLAGIGAQAADSDLTAIAALTTTSFGRARLTDADAAAARSALGVAQDLSGTTAARPAASAVPAGTTYLSTTDGSYARSDGSAWTNLVPQELGYAEITSDFSTTSTSYVEVTGLSLTVPVGAAGRVLIEFGCMSILQLTAGRGFYAGFRRGAGAGDETRGDIYGTSSSASEASPGPYMAWRKTGLTAGSYLFRVMLATDGVGTARIGAAPTAPAWFKIREF